MSYSELDRTYIRRYIGYGAVYIQAEPRLETAISSTQSIADGGSRPDSSVENYVKGLIYGAAAVTGTQTGVTPGPVSTTGVTFAQPAIRGLLQIELAIAQQDVFLGALKADGGDAEIDPARERASLRKEGRRLCHALARILGLKGVRVDIFSSSEVINDAGDPFAYSDLEHWRGGP